MKVYYMTHRYEGEIFAIFQSKELAEAYLEAERDYRAEDKDRYRSDSKGNYTDERWQIIWKENETRTPSVTVYGLFEIETED